MFSKGPQAVQNYLNRLRSDSVVIKGKLLCFMGRSVLRFVELCTYCKDYSREQKLPLSINKVSI